MKKILILFCVLFSAVMVNGQIVAVKTNAYAWLTGTVNVGVEAAIAPKVSLEAMAYGNFIPFSSDYKFTLGVFQPGVRYWFNEVFSRSFVGIHATGGGGEFTWKGTRRQGVFGGAGISYGYAWLIGSRWNLETEIGVSVVHGRYRVQNNDRTWSGFKSKTGILPSKLGLTFSYLF